MKAKHLAKSQQSLHVSFNLTIMDVNITAHKLQT